MTSTKILYPLLAAALFATACTATADRPADTVAAYAEAVRTGDADAAYDLLDDTARGEMSREAFHAFFETHRAALVQDAAKVGSIAAETPMAITGEVPVSGRAEASVAYIDGQWLIDDPSPAARHQATPRDALVAFAAALDESNFAEVLPLLSGRQRAAYGSELQTLRESITRAIDKNIVTDGNRAVLALDGGDKIILIREDGEWRIQEFQQSRK